jgi:lipopolysaccharide biosynthesis glycosyltransferase
MNIAYSSSEYYFEPTLVSIYSLLKNSRDKHVIILLSSGIPQWKVNKLKAVVIDNGSEFKCLDITEKLNKIASDFQFPLMRGGYSTYARIFLSDILMDFSDVLLIDSDTIILGEIVEILTEKSNHVMLACRDYVVSNRYSRHEDQELSKNPYYNMGVLYINLEKWRKLELTKILAQNYDRNYNLHIADQSILNKYLSDYIGETNIKFNYYTYFHYGFNHEYYKQLNNETSFAGKEELSLAKSKPIVIHFIGTWYERPWFKFNISPYKKIYKVYWIQCFSKDRLFNIPSLSIRNFLYDSVSVLIYKILGLKSYFKFRYKFIQWLKYLK